MTRALQAPPIGLVPRFAWTREPLPGWDTRVPAASPRSRGRSRRRRPLGVALLAALACLLGLSTTADTVAPGPSVAAPVVDPCGPAWVRAWQASVQPVAADLAGATLRMVVNPGATGERARMRLSNRFGATPLTVGAATAAGSDGAGGLLPGTVTPITFAGAPAVTIAPGAETTSDPVALATQAGRPVAVSLRLDAAPAVVARHPVALQTSYLVRGRDAVASPVLGSGAEPVPSWLVLTGLDVLNPQPVAAVVAVGDSITDGLGAATDQRWSDVLSGRLAAAGGGARMVVLNAGLSGNRLLADDPARDDESPLARFDTDVAAAAGVADVVLNIGTNDIASGRSAAEVIAGLRGFADRTRASGVRVLLSTITPSTFGPHGTTAAVRARETVNDWVRAHGREHADGVVDFAAAVADPANPRRLARPYDAGDGLHLSAAGYRAMAAAVDPSALSGSPCLGARPPAVVAAGS